MKQVFIRAESSGEHYFSHCAVSQGVLIFPQSKMAACRQRRDWVLWFPHHRNKPALIDINTYFELQIQSIWKIYSDILPHKAHLSLPFSTPMGYRIVNTFRYRWVIIAPSWEMGREPKYAVLIQRGTLHFQWAANILCSSISAAIVLI